MSESARGSGVLEITEFSLSDSVLELRVVLELKTDVEPTPFACKKGVTGTTLFPSLK